jgi:hypothetical protein
MNMGSTTLGVRLELQARGTPKIKKIANYFSHYAHNLAKKDN